MPFKVALEQIIIIINDSILIEQFNKQMIAKNIIQFARIQ